MSYNHWMMFGTFAEQRHFTYPNKNAYRGVIINANMVAHAPDGIAKFIQTQTAPPNTYLIDPQTHAFQHNPKHIIGQNNELKKSIKKLVEQYGEPIQSVAGEKPLSFKDMSVKKAQIMLTENCIEFQRTFISSRIEESEDRKYISFDSNNNSTSPHAIIAPYFYLQEASYKEWLDINIELVRYSMERCVDEKCFAMVVLSRGILTNNEAFDEIISRYQDTDVSGFIIWIDNLAEFDCGSAELTGLIKLARELNTGGEKEVINLHGGYFSTLATSPRWTRRSFTGVCHGPEFGEYRSVVPVGGGIPIAKYYIPHLHNRVRYKDAGPLFQKKGYFNSASEFYSKVCNCDECRNNLKSNPDMNFYTVYGDSKVSLRKTRSGFVAIEYPTQETKIHCLRHYLEQKNIEYKYVASKSLDELKRDLQNDYEKYSDIIGDDSIAYLQLWERVLWKELNT